MADVLTISINGKMLRMRAAQLTTTSLRRDQAQTKIGAAARASGLTIKAIRHYESVGLFRNVPRSGAYRDFSERDVATLRLAAHCRGLGFSVAETKDVLALVMASEPDCPPPDQMNAIVESRLRTVRDEIRELERKARELEKIRTYVQKRLAGA